MNNYRFLSFKIFLYFCIILKQISIKDFISLLSQIILQILYFDFVMIRIYVNTYRFLSFKIFLYFCIILKQILDQRFYFLSQIILQILYFDFVMINLRVDKNRIQYLNFKYSISSCPFWNYLSRFLLSFFFFFFFSQFFPEQLEFHIGETNMDILVSMAAEEYALFWMFEMKELRNIHNNWNSKHIVCATVLTICPILQRGKIAEEEFLEWDSIDCEIIRGIDTRWEIVRFQIGFRRKERERERERERQVFYVRGWSRYLRWSKRHKDGLICKWLHRCVVQE